MLRRFRAVPQALRVPLHAKAEGEALMLHALDHAIRRCCGYAQPFAQLLHRLMMNMVYSKAKRTPPEEQTDETREMTASYNQTVDFVDLDSLNQLKY